MSCLFLHKAPQALARELNKSSPVDLSPSVTLVILQKLIARLSIGTSLHISRDIAIMLKPSLDLTSLDRIELYFWNNFSCFSSPSHLFQKNGQSGWNRTLFPASHWRWRLKHWRSHKACFIVIIIIFVVVIITIAIVVVIIINILASSGLYNQECLFWQQIIPHNHQESDQECCLEGRGKCSVICQSFEFLDYFSNFIQIKLVRGGGFSVVTTFLKPLFIEVPEVKLNQAVQRGEETVVFSGKSVSLLTGLLFSGHYDHIIAR